MGSISECDVVESMTGGDECVTAWLKADANTEKKQCHEKCERLQETALLSRDEPLIILERHLDAIRYENEALKLSIVPTVKKQSM